MKRDDSLSRNNGGLSGESLEEPMSVEVGSVVVHEEVPKDC